MNITHYFKEMTPKKQILETKESPSIPKMNEDSNDSFFDFDFIEQKIQYQSNHSEITLKNPNILSFFQKYSHLEPESFILSITTFVDSFLTNQNNDIQKEKSMLEHILSISQQTNQQINHLSHQGLQQMIHSSKQDFLFELNSILSSFDSNNIEKTNLLLHSQTNQFFDKCSSLFQDILPKNQYLHEKSVFDMKTSISHLKDEMKSDLSLLLRNSQPQSSVEQQTNQYVNQLSNQLCSTIFNYIHSSEERITSNLSKFDSREHLFNDLADFLQKNRNSSSKGQMGENRLDKLLNQLYPSGEIINTTSTRASCDFLLKRENKNDILLETKAYDRNVNPDEVKKFERDISEKNLSGLFLSQTSGITSKSNFEINIMNTNVLLYIHHVNYDSLLIRTGIDIVDSLSKQIKELHMDNENDKEEIMIKKEMMEVFISEYNEMIEKKMRIIQIMKENHKKEIGMMEELVCNELSSFLKTTNVVENKITNGHLCDICNMYEGKSMRSLAAHRKICLKKKEKTEKE